MVSALPRLAGLARRVKKTSGDRVVVLTLAIESDEAEVRKLAGTLNLPVHWALRTPAALQAFGDVSAVPTMLILDQRGQRAGAYYGSTPVLHADAAATIAAPQR